MIKNTISLLILLIICSGCQDRQELEAKFDIDNYLDLEFVKFEQAGKSLLLPKIKLAESKDSIGTKINKNPRRYDYLLQNRISADSILRVLPDTTKAKSVYISLLNDEDFKDYFYSTYYIDGANEKQFSEEELMKIASKFFLMEKTRDNYRTRICIGINGLTGSEYDNRDYTLLEAIVYEAIFERITQKNKEEPLFLKNLDTYSSQAMSSLDKNVEDSLAFVRTYVFEAMEKDKELKNHILSYIKANKDNIAVKIVQ